MRVQILLLTFLLLYIIPSKSQSSISHELMIGSGYAQYMKSSGLPSGLPGAGGNISYRGEWMGKNPTTDHVVWDVALKYLHLDKSQLRQPYHHAEFKLGGYWLGQLPIPSSSFTGYMGAGLSWRGKGGMSWPLIHNIFLLRPYGNWFVSTDFAATFRYKIGAWKLDWRMDVPLLMGGFFEEYQYIPSSIEEGVPYVATPNAIVPFWNYFNLNTSLSASYGFRSKNNKQHSIRFAFEYECLESYVFHNQERKQYVGLAVGWEFSCLGTRIN